MPLMSASGVLDSRGEKRASINGVEFARMLDIHRYFIEMVIVEKVTASPKMGVTSSFRFGEGFGIIRGILAAFRLREILVSPSVWKLNLGISADKKKSIALAKKLFPDWSFGQAKAADEQEAALLAYYGSKFLGGNADYGN